MPRLSQRAAVAEPAEYLQHPAYLPERIDGTVCLDTETSGLHVDSGARVAVVSLAWYQHGADGCEATIQQIVTDTDEVYQEQRITAPDGFVLNVPWYDCTNPACLHSVAYPFDQGKEGKPEDDGQMGLFGDAVNLGVDAWDTLIAWLRRQRISMHNRYFDALIMRAGHREYGHGADLYNLIDWDTQVVNRELWPRESTSLKPTGGRLFGADVRDNEQALKTYLRKSKLPTGRWDLVPWDMIVDYATMDAVLTKRLEQEQLRRIINQGEQHRTRTVDWIRREFEVTRVLYGMECRGVPYPADESAQIAARLTKDRDAIGKRLPFRPTNPAAKQYYFDEGTTTRGVQCLNLQPYKVSPKTHEPSLTADILARMAAEGAPHAKDWADWNRLDNAVSMWYGGYADKTNPQDHRLRTHYRQLQVKTGRFSVERVNLQAIPSDFKMVGKGDSPLLGTPTPRQLIARAVQRFCPGWVLAEIDLAQAELRMAAFMAGCQKMLDMVLAGADLHGYTASSIFPEADVNHRDWKLYRQLGKRSNFSCVFGAGWKTVQEMVLQDSGILLPDYECAMAVQNWNGLYPEFDAALDYHEQVVKRQRKIRLINGRMSHFTDYDDYRSGFSRRVQGSLAEVGKDLDILVDRRMADWKIQDRADADGIGGAGLLLAIHDSQLMLLPADEAPQLLDDLVREGAALATEMCGTPMAMDSKIWEVGEAA